MKRYGLTGYPLSHSFSKKYFEEKFKRDNIQDCTYNLFPLPHADLLEGFLRNSELNGINVTIPYKQAVLPLLDSVSDEAKAIGAVNCIRIVNGKLYGFNTDVYGFEVSLTRLINSRPQTAFVLGTGGSSLAVCYVLKKMGIRFHIVSRTPEEGQIGYADIEHVLSQENLFINTTPVGTYPDIYDSPDIPYHLLKPADYLFDLVYNPSETEFLKKGKLAGCKVKNGLEMLELQAEKSWEIWNS